MPSLGEDGERRTPASQIVELDEQPALTAEPLPVIRNSTAQTPRYSVLDTDDRLGVLPPLHRLISQL
jgi:hypothetical protein